MNEINETNEFTSFEQSKYIGIYLNNLRKRCIKQLLINKQHLKRK